MCSITYTSLVLSGDGTTLTLTGTSDCAILGVSITNFTNSKTTQVINGTWTVTFTAADLLAGHTMEELRERCGDWIQTMGVCEDDPDCKDAGDVQLRCPPGGGDNGDCCSMICCMVFKLLVLLGFGLAGLGSIMVVCSFGLCDPKAMDQIGYGFRIWGTLLFVIGMAFWLTLCKPKKCEWLALLWQMFILAGLLFIYAGLCPECLRMLYYGLAAFIFGLLLYWYWVKTCDVSLCKKLSEWTGLFLIPVNALIGHEAILLACANERRMISWAIIAFIILFEAFLLYMLKKNNCLKC